MWWACFSFLTFLFAYLGKKEVTKNPQLRIFYRCCLVFVLGYVIGLGGQTFTDHIHYLNTYENLGKLEIESGYNIFEKVEGNELGFFALSWLIKSLGFTYVGFFLIIALLTNSLIVPVFYRFKYPVIAVMIFITSVYFSQQCNLVRQMLAGAIALYIIRYVAERDWKRYLVGVLIAILFHRSAILMILFIPLCFADDKDYNIVRYAITGIWAISFLYAWNLLHVHLNDNLVHFFIMGDLESYLTNENRVSSGGEFSINYFYQFFVLLWVSYLHKYKKTDIYAIFFVLGGIIMNFQEQIPTMIRISLFYAIIFVAFIPEMLMTPKSIPSKEKKVMQVLLYIFVARYAAVHISHILTSNQILGVKMYSIFDIF